MVSPNPRISQFFVCSLGVSPLKKKLYIFYNREEFHRFIFMTLDLIVLDAITPLLMKKSKGEKFDSAIFDNIISLFIY